MADCLRSVAHGSWMYCLGSCSSMMNPQCGGMWCCPGVSSLEEEEVRAQDEVDSDLLAAVLRADIQSVQQLLQQQHNPNMYTTADEPLLLVAVKHGQEDMVRLLINQGADANQYDSHGKTVLHYVACTNKHDLLDFMLRTGGSPNCRDSENKTPLHYCAAVNEVENLCILVRAGGDCECMDTQQMTPLLTAAKHGSSNVGSTLIILNADVNHKDMNDYTALHHASRGGFVVTADILLNNAAQFGQTALGDSELMLAVESGSIALVKLLIEHGIDINVINRKKMCALHVAAKLNHTECTQLLCKRGAIMDLQDRKGLTPMMLAAKHGHVQIVKLSIDGGCLVNVQDSIMLTALHLAAIHGHLDCVSALLRAKARVDVQGQNGNLALMLAAHNGHIEITKMLLGACREHRYWNINIGNLDQMTPLHMAADKGHVECVDLLLAEGADPGRPNRNGDTPLILAAKRGHHVVVRTIVKFASSDPNSILNQFNIMRKTAMHVATKVGSVKCVETLLSCGALPDVRDSHGKTPLIIACEHGYDNLVDMLIKSQADINVRTDEGWSALHMAAQNNHVNVTRMLLTAGVEPDISVWMNDITPCLIAASRGHYSIVKLLIKKGSNVNHCEFNGMTALHKAARGGHAQCVKLLIANGGQVDPESLHGLTPAMLSIKEGHRKVLRILLEANCNVDKLDPFQTKPNKKFSTIFEMLMMSGCRVDRKYLDEMVSTSRLPRPLVDDTALLDHVWCWTSNVRSLKNLSREAIRRSVGANINNKVDGLPLPTYLKEFLLLKELKTLTDATDTPVPVRQAAAADATED